MNTTTSIKLAACGLAGIATGALAFVSFVDTRTILNFIDKDNTDIIKTWFPIWWPNGRDFMVSVLGLTTTTHLAAQYLTEDKTYFMTAALIASIGIYTHFVLGEDIEGLRKADKGNVKEMARRFCLLHHLRLLFAIGGFSGSLYLLVK
eukprot:TRINITY_DN3660_c0_g1_i3.p2 TRINITY_DN3660_c0_g1~~TRINITY_DN3660_c0_g1_i3.p2  ORF type:complete len:148 (+),score=24.08 TRINITY_DN3660_c0_g1_i3:567-1010(+)